MITLTLPVPPSSNRLWRSAKGRTYKAPAYTDWLSEAYGRIAAARAADQVPYRFTVRIVMPKTRTDLDNAIKPILDCLQRSGVVVDDRYCVEVTACRDETRDPDTVAVEVTPLPDPMPKALARRREKAGLLWKMAVPVAPL